MTYNDEGGVMAARMLEAARLLRAAYPDESAMRRVAVPDQAENGTARPSAVRQAVRYLRDEMVLVRGGRAGGVGVLDDEIAHTEAVLRGV